MSTHSPLHHPDPIGDSPLRPTGSPIGRPGASRPAARARLSARTQTRLAILEGARAAIIASGSRITMAQIATEAEVAKATLYNHFRTREDVLQALLLAELERVIEAVAHLQPAEALTRAALAVSDHPLLEALGGADLAVLAVLGRVDVETVGWKRVAQAVDQLLAAHGRRGTSTVLRWLSSFVVAPADRIDIDADVAVLIAGLPPIR